VTVQRRASSTGVIMVAGQKIALGRIHAGQVVNVHVAAETVTILGPICQESGGTRHGHGHGPDTDGDPCQALLDMRHRGFT
jgi:hypothetical protein